MSSLSPKPGRRAFLKKSATAALGFYIVPRHVLGGRGYTPPSDKLNIAGVGCGGKGWVDLLGAWDEGRENIVALCDVDTKRSAEAVAKWPSAKFYADYRVMLDAEKDIDAVIVSTPDHTHGAIAMAAMQRGKHVYVQKPLAHNIYEVRTMTEAARKYQVVTQMGNQGSSGDGVRTMEEWYKAGLIGSCERVHVWTNRPIWPQGIGMPTDKPPVPPELNWDLWLGPAQWQDYHPVLHPFNWRGWTAYGTGALGDMGCHMMHPPYKILGLGYPSEVECSVTNNWTGNFQLGYFPESFPTASAIHMKFPRTGKKTVALSWYDGGILPERPEQIPPNVTLGDPFSGGVLMIGSKGVMMCGLYGNNPSLWPEKLMEKTEKVPQSVPRVVNKDKAGHYQQWLAACKAGYASGQWKTLSAHFDQAGPFSEAVLMGNLAILSHNYRRERKKEDKGWLQEYDYPGRIRLLWDGPNMKITNLDEANQFVRREYRKGWSL